MKGSCFCGEVVYQIQPPFKGFQYCHCSRCRKFTGSAHASNLFVAPEQFQWLQGEHLVGRYEPVATKYFATCFCQRCGSSLPWLNKAGNLVIVTAGTLDESPGMEPVQSIYWESRATWYVSPDCLKKYASLPGSD